MIAFELSMPNRGSWDNKWSGDGECFVRVRRQSAVPKEYWNKSFFYTWSDGWTACVTTRQVNNAEANKLRRKSKGFRGYDWMIESIIKHGSIATDREWEEKRKEKK